MGIQNLNKVPSFFIDESEEYPFMQIPVSYLRGRKVAYDANGYFFRIKMAFIVKQDDLLDISTGEYDKKELNTRFLHEILRVVTGILRDGIIPIFVFDGKAPVEKLATQNNRESITNDSNNKLNELIKNVKEGLIILDEKTHSEIIKLSRKGQVFNRKEAQKLKSYLKELGLPCVQSNTEAERLCSMMTREGIAFAVNSNDTDCIAHGAKYCITKREGAYFQITSSRRFRRMIDLPNDKFLILCILLGCDYNKKIPLTKKGHGNTKQLITWLRETTVENIKADINSRFPEVLLERCIELFSPVPCLELLSNSEEMSNFDLGEPKEELSFYIDSSFYRNYLREFNKNKSDGVLEDEEESEDAIDSIKRALENM